MKYDKRFKDLLSQIPYIIDEALLVQWYIAGLLQKIRGHLKRHEVRTCEEALKMF